MGFFSNYCSDLTSPDPKTIDIAMDSQVQETWSEIPLTAIEDSVAAKLAEEAMAMGKQALVFALEACKLRQLAEDATQKAQQLEAKAQSTKAEAWKIMREAMRHQPIQSEADDAFWSDWFRVPNNVDEEEEDEGNGAP